MSAALNSCQQTDYIYQLTLLFLICQIFIYGEAVALDWLTDWQHLDRALALSGQLKEICWMNVTLLRTWIRWMFVVAFSSALMKWIWLMSRLSGKWPGRPDFGLSGQVFISKALLKFGAIKAHKGDISQVMSYMSNMQFEKCSKCNKSPLAKRQNSLLRVDI